MRKNEILETPRKSPDEIYAFYSIIKILKDTQKFREWLRNYHKISNDESILVGYKFLSEVATRKFIDSIIRDPSMNMNEDFTLSRATFVGTQIEDIPNTCDKVVILKNIWKYSKPIKKSKTWEELEKGIKEFDSKVLSYFEKILEKDVIISKKVSKKSKEEILKIISMFYTCIFLVDTSRGIPHGYHVSILKESLSQKYMEAIFEGYKFALQFLWYNFLGEKFERCSLKELHKAEKIFKEEKLFSPFEEELIKGERKFLNDQTFKTTLKWRSIDKFFRKTLEDVIEPIERELSIKFVFEKLLLIENNIDKESFGSLLSEKLKDPEYLTKGNKESLTKRLDYFLFWYPHVEILDTRKTLVFNGVPAFISTFIGSVEMKRRFGIEDKVYTIRFKHPDPEVKGNDYSYGVLIEAAGTSGLTDYSGWLIFYDCCGDYSGFAGFEHALAEVFLEKYEKGGLIEVREFELDKKQFREFLAGKLVLGKGIEFIKELKLETLRKRIRDRFSESKGTLLELLLYYALSKKAFEKIEWSYKKANIEVDVIAKKENEIWFVECKNPIEIKKESLKKKVGNLLNNSEFKKEWSITENTKARLIYCFWEKPVPSSMKLFDDPQIEIWILRNKIKELGVFKNKDLSKIKFIFSTLEENRRPDFDYLP